MRFARRWLCLVAALVACDGGSDPVENARRFERLRLSGDLRGVYDLLADADRRDLPLEPFLVGGAPALGIRRGGWPAATLDSVIERRRATDTALVETYVSAPDWSRLERELADSLAAGTVDSARRNSLASSLPRVSLSNARRLVREQGRWKIRVQATERAQLDSMAALMREPDQPLAVRGAHARRVLEFDSVSGGLLPFTERAAVAQVVRQAALADSLRVTVEVRAGYFLRSARGTVHNAGAQPIAALTLLLTDARDSTAVVTVQDIPARGSRNFAERTELRAGTPARVAIIGVQTP